MILISYLMLQLNRISNNAISFGLMNLLWQFIKISVQIFFNDLNMVF